MSTFLDSYRPSVICDCLSPSLRNRPKMETKGLLPSGARLIELYESFIQRVSTRMSLVSAPILVIVEGESIFLPAPKLGTISVSDDFLQLDFDNSLYMLARAVMSPIWPSRRPPSQPAATIDYGGSAFTPRMAMLFGIGLDPTAVVIDIHAEKELFLHEMREFALRDAAYPKPYSRTITAHSAVAIRNRKDNDQVDSEFETLVYPSFPEDMQVPDERRVKDMRLLFLPPGAGRGSISYSWEDGSETAMMTESRIERTGDGKFAFPDAVQKIVPIPEFSL